MSPVRDIGIDVRAPKREPAPGDKLNPFNGTLPVRGTTLVGRVVNHRMQGTVIVENERSHYVPKFQRYEKRTSRYPAHVPSNIDVDIGDEVTIAECRPISKTVHYVVVENRGDAAGEAQDATPAAKRTTSSGAAGGATKAGSQGAQRARKKAASKTPGEAADGKGAPAKKTAAKKTAAKTAKKEAA